MAGSLALSCAAHGAAVAWVVPSYKNARPVWRFVEQFAGGIAELRVSDRLAKFPGAGWLGIYTADNDVSMRGEAFDVVIVDEAARVSEQTYQDVIVPTLADRDGRIMLISTPKARNWFYTEWLRGKEDGARIASWQAPTCANPSPNIRKAYELAKLNLPSRTFRQEWDAEFIEGEGSVFRNVRAVCVLDSQSEPSAHAGHNLVMGVDWGKSNDFTRLRVLCVDCKRMLDWDGFNKIDYHFQRERLSVMANRWKVSAILPERNSMGEPNVEEMQRSGLPIMAGPDGKPGFNMSATSKPPLIESLSLAMEQGDIQLPKEDAGELEAYELKTNINGHPTYSAPAGTHDDRVIADALAWWAAIHPPIKRSRAVVSW